jgi:hypothetical protein
MYEFERFRKKAVAEGLSKPQPPLQWFFVSIVQQEGGAFVGGSFVQASGWMKACDAAMERDVWSQGKHDLIFNEAVPVPDDQLPASEYRNHLLTLAEVCEVWPWVRA